MAERITPYGAFNFIVNFDGGEEFGGFSDVSGIGTEVTVAEYRAGNDKENHVRKVAGIHKVSDVTCKRGIVNFDSLWAWIEQTRTDWALFTGSLTLYVPATVSGFDREIGTVLKAGACQDREASS